MRNKIVYYVAMLTLTALLTACAAGGHVGSVGGGVHAF